MLAAAEVEEVQDDSRDQKQHSKSVALGGCWPCHRIATSPSAMTSSQRTVSPSVHISGLLCSSYHHCWWLCTSAHSQTMSLIHALVARGTTVLAEHAATTGELKPGPSLRPLCHTQTDHPQPPKSPSFPRSRQTTRSSRVRPDGTPCEGGVLTVSDVWQDRLIHYVSSDGIIYLVMADDSVGRRMPFGFLGEVERKVRHKQRWETTPADRMQFTAMFDQDTVVSAAAHSLEEFEPELAKVSLRRATSRGLTSFQLMHQYTNSPPNDPLKQARTDMDNVFVAILSGGSKR